jgi:hypothetical protein
MDRNGKPTPPDALDLSKPETSTGADVSAKARDIMAAAAAEPVPERLKILALALGEVLETPAANGQRPPKTRRGTH